MASREVLSELATAFAGASGQPVLAEAAGGLDVAKRVAADEPVDVVVLASGAIDKLIAQGKLIAGSRADLMRSGIAVAVRAGAAKPDISTEEALMRTVLAAPSLGYSTGPSGVHLEKTFERWGILAQVQPRIVVPPPGTPVGSLVASGVVALGFQQLSELQALPGVEVVGPLPPPAQTMTVFSGAIAVTSGRHEAARALLAYLSSQSASAAKRRFGMEPA